MSAELSERASELPLGDRTYGDTSQLLGLTPKQPIEEVVPATTPWSGLDARRYPGQSHAQVETVLSRLHPLDDRV
jgi:hypothetical protein